MNEFLIIFIEEYL